MSCPSLCRARGSLRAEYPLHGPILHCVVRSCRRPVQVDVVDIRGLETRPIQRLAHGANGTGTFGMRVGHVIAIRAFTVSEQRNGALSSHLLTGFEQGVARGFTEREAVTIFVAGAARLGRQELQGG